MKTLYANSKIIKKFQTKKILRVRKTLFLLTESYSSNLIHYHYRKNEIVSSFEFRYPLSCKWYIQEKIKCSLNIFSLNSLCATENESISFSHCHSASTECMKNPQWHLDGCRKSKISSHFDCKRVSASFGKHLIRAWR